MPRVTYTATDLVWIEVLGEKPDLSAANRNAGDLIDRLQAFLHAAKISPLRTPLGMASPGAYRYAFTPAAAPHVLAWLEKNHVTLTAGGET